MYRGQLWTMRQFAGFGSPEETNERFRFLLERGQTALSVAFDLPTQLGYDSGHPEASAEVGRVGVADRHRRRHGGSVRRSAARPHLGELHDQRDRPDHPGDVSGRGRAPGRRSRGPRRHHAERHLEGVPRAQDVRLPAGALDPSVLRRDRVRRRDAAAVQPDLDHGLPRARGGLRRRAGAGAHAGLGDRVRRTARGTRAGVRHLRPPAVVPLRDDDGSVRGGGEAPGREADVVPDRDRAVRRDRARARDACGSSRGTRARR